MESAATDESFINDVITRVSAYDVRRCDPYPETSKDFKRAAVLLPLRVHNGKVDILLTKRSLGLRSHPGSVSFPGGKRDESDSSDVETALREAEEEIGLPQEKVQVIGVLTRGITLPSTVVYPVVGLIPHDFEPAPNPTEVEFAFFMPLKDFIEADKISYSIMDIYGKPFISRSVHYEGNGRAANVWGFTANFCTLIAKIVFQEKSFIQVFYDSNGDGGGKELDCELKEYFEHMSSVHALKLKSKL
ncbi:uncharacterized Nudix hydrolase NudL [Aplysia californica]|uniref:Uncharacterized Nudix hydrolase NudL n=1 Tax=Aplysia californica TaxID=6500 RepID=A0ABM0JCI8_APLCA|nr:uncharacterized Nudix hydrolase NudL [Aplysia californica]XP_035827458.1 uncharacterized Nudix hydrolase NudL [Aplysia californica]